MNTVFDYTFDHRDIATEVKVHMVTLPKALQVPVVDAELADMPAWQPGDLVVAVPDQWAWLAQTASSPAAHAWPPEVVGISSMAPLPADVQTALTSPHAGGTPTLHR